MQVSQRVNFVFKSSFQILQLLERERKRGKKENKRRKNKRRKK